MTNLEITLLTSSVALLITTVTFAWLYLNARVALSKTESSLENAEQMRQTFQNMANEALAGNTEKFLNIAKIALEKETAQAQSDLEKKSIEFNKTIAPIQTLLEKYQQHLSQMELERQRAFTKIESEIKRVAEISGVLGVETTALKNALKKPHVRGRWGEVQLKNCVELAGMSEYADVTFQGQHETSDSQRLIPDMTVRMPGGRIVIVDAKTPIDAFLSSLESTDEESRAVELARHGRHVKEHVKKLAAKAYSENLKSTADFTVMFLPNESFLYAALEAEPDLVEFAIQKKILIATPPTFIGLLKVIRFGWNEERLAENAQQISEVGTELHKRVCDFVEGFESIGKHLDKARMEYEAGLGRLQSRVLTQAKKLETLGAKSPKSLPENIQHEI